MFREYQVRRRRKPLNTPCSDCGVGERAYPFGSYCRDCHRIRSRQYRHAYDKRKLIKRLAKHRGE